MLLWGPQHLIYFPFELWYTTPIWYETYIYPQILDKETRYLKVNKLEGFTHYGTTRYHLIDLG